MHPFDRSAMADEIACLAATVARREAGQQAADKARRSRVPLRAAHRGALQQQFLLWCADALHLQARLIDNALAPTGFRLKQTAEKPRNHLVLEHAAGDIVTRSEVTLERGAHQRHALRLVLHDDGIVRIADGTDEPYADRPIQTLDEPYAAALLGQFVRRVVR